MLKRTRATLHERFASWAEQVNRDRQRETEYEEILGYHLEQAYRYLFQLGPIDDHARTIGERAATKLAATGRRAFERGDMAAAANLLERATALLEPLDPRRLALFPELGEALLQVGEFAHAESLLQDAVATAEVASEPTLAANAELVRMLVVLLSGDSHGWEGVATKAAAGRDRRSASGPVTTSGLRARIAYWRGCTAGRLGGAQPQHRWSTRSTVRGAPAT